MITDEDYFGRMSRAAGEEPSAEIRANAAILLERVNALLSEPGIRPRQWAVTSGWRTPAHNASIANAAPKSKHLSGQAIDIADPDNSLDAFLVTRLELLEQNQLWIESPIATSGWCHLQCVPPRSGNRVFLP